MSIRRYVIIFFLTLVLLINLLGVLPYIQWISFRQADEKLVRHYITAGELHEVLNLVTDMETGQRGYILTRNPEFLTPFLRAHGLSQDDPGVFEDVNLDAHMDEEGAPERVEEQLALLQKNLAGDPDMLVALGELREMIVRKNVHINNVLTVSRRSGFDAAAEMVMQGHGRQVMEEIRGKIDEMLERLETDTRATVQETNRRMESYAMFVVVGNVVLGILLTLSFWGIASGRKQAIAARRRIEKTDEQLQRFIRHAPAAVGALDRDLKFVIASDRWASEFDSHWYHNATGMYLREVLPYFDTRKDWQDAVLRCLNGESVVVNEDRIERPGQPDIWARWELHPWGDPGESGTGHDGIIISIENITRRKEAEKMKEEFVSTVSHELRTPLTSIRGSLGLIAGGVAGPLPDKARDLIDIAHKNSERLILLINDILDMNKLEADLMSLSLAPYAVNGLVREAVESNQGYADRFSVRIDMDFDADENDEILVDSHRFQQVMSNLISNAVKFSPENGVVTVTCARESDRVKVSVSDRGAGIPKKFRSQIFQKFAQADSSDTRARAGTGLGLSITKGLVERMNGWVAFETEEGAGTTFFVEFPVYMPADAAGDPDGGTGTGKKRVLHVEDDIDFYRVIRSGLETHVHVNNARTIRDAQMHIDRKGYDLVVLDLRLPDGNGLSLLPYLRRKERCPIVVISAYDIPEDVRPLATACLIKAETPESEMIATILRLLGLEETQKMAGLA